MVISVCHAVDAATGRRYDLAHFQTKGREHLLKAAHRRWYCATVVASDETVYVDPYEDSYHTVLHERLGEDVTDKNRRERPILKPVDRVEPNSGTAKFGTWCVGPHYRGRTTFAPSDETVAVKATASATPISRRRPPPGLGATPASATAPDRGRTVAEVVGFYFDPQVGWYCGIHAVNNAIGAEAFTPHGVEAYIAAGLRRPASATARPVWWADRNDAGVIAGQAATDADDKRHGRSRTGFRNWSTFSEGSAGGVTVYDNYSTGFLKTLLDDTGATWATNIGVRSQGSEAAVTEAMTAVERATARGGASGFVLRTPGHYTAIRGTNGADLTRPDPTTEGRHYFHTIDSQDREGVAGKTAAEVRALLRAQLAAGGDVLVVGIEADRFATPSPKRLRLLRGEADAGDANGADDTNDAGNENGTDDTSGVGGMDNSAPPATKHVRQGPPTEPGGRRLATTTLTDETGNTDGARTTSSARTAAAKTTDAVTRAADATSVASPAGGVADTAAAAGKAAKTTDAAPRVPSEARQKLRRLQARKARGTTRPASGSADDDGATKRARTGQPPAQRDGATTTGVAMDEDDAGLTTDDEAAMKAGATAADAMEAGRAATATNAMEVEVEASGITAVATGYLDGRAAAATTTTTAAPAGAAATAVASAADAMEVGAEAPAHSAGGTTMATAAAGRPPLPPPPPMQPPPPGTTATVTEYIVAFAAKGTGERATTWAEYFAGPECLAARTAAATGAAMSAMDARAAAAMVATATDAMEVETGAPAHGEGSSAMEVEAEAAAEKKKKEKKKNRGGKSERMSRNARKREKKRRQDQGQGDDEDV